MDKKDKYLLSLFDVDDDLVDDFSINLIENNYFASFKFKPLLKYCPKCGSIHFHSKGNFVQTLTHSPINNHICKVKTSVKRYKCIDCNSNFKEVNPIAHTGTSFTKVAVICILQDLKPYTSTYSATARKYGVSNTKIIELFDNFVQIKRKSLPGILLLDEFYFGEKAKYQYPTLLMNFENNLIIDIVESRKHEIITNYFFSIPKKERETVEFICTDMSFIFKPLLTTFFENATLIVDHFHVTKYVNDQLNNTRKRIMSKYAHNKKTLEYRLLKHRYKLLLRSHNKVDNEIFKKDRILEYTTTDNGVLEKLLAIDIELEEAYKIKEEYLNFDQCTLEKIDNCDKEAELKSLIKRCRKSNIEEMIKVADTLTNWKKEILNSFTWIGNRRISNGPIEGKNNYIKKYFQMQMA